MPRTDNDSWTITESVGATALGVAAARAAETESENPLIEDPFARVFVDAAGDGMWSMFANPALLAGAPEIESQVGARVRQMIDFMATRTAFFDEFFLGAADAGVRQVVILASGLDSRAWRLPWPDGTVVYELDQPRVLEFKSATLRQHGARPTAQLMNIPIDLRQDWPAALLDSGFDASKPTAWSAEGWCATFRRGLRICCSSASIRSAPPEAGWQPTCPREASWIPIWCAVNTRKCSGCERRPADWWRSRCRPSKTFGTPKSAPRSRIGWVSTAGARRPRPRPNC